MWVWVGEWVSTASSQSRVCLPRTPREHNDDRTARSRRRGGGGEGAAELRAGNVGGVVGMVLPCQRDHNLLTSFWLCHPSPSRVFVECGKWLSEIQPRHCNYKPPHSLDCPQLAFSLLARTVGAGWRRELGVGLVTVCRCVHLKG